MFKNFCAYFDISEISSDRAVSNTENSPEGFIELMNSLGGKSFNKGLYRLHQIDNIMKWNSIIVQAFPEFKGRITCFGFDWLGRQFALDSERIENGQPQILMFEPGTAEVLEVPCDFIQFHEEEIPDYHDACLASEFFQEWMSRNPDSIKDNECIGYKVMLFLGGEDKVENLEKSDLEVYWEICSQLIQKSKELPEGAEIKDIKISEQA